MNGHLRLPVLIATFALVSSSLAFGAGHQAGAEDRQASGEGCARAEEAGRARRRMPAPPPAPPSDVRYKATYVNADHKTDSTTFVRDSRERYELGDTILIKQRDQKRTVQISRGANTYLITPDGAAAAAAAVAAAQRPPRNLQAS